MRSLVFAAAALWVLLTPALAQQSDQPFADQAQQADQTVADQAQQAPSAETQPAATDEAQPFDQTLQPAATDETQPADGPAGMTQAAAQLAAQADEQQAEQQNSDAQPAPEQAPIEQQPAVQSDEQSAMQDEQSAMQNAPPQSGEQAPNPPPVSDEDDAAQPDAPPFGATQTSDPARPAQAEYPQAEYPQAQYPEAQYPNAAPPLPARPSTMPRRALQLPPAIRPRAEAAAYPVYRRQQQLSIGAELLSAKEVEQKFSTPLGKHYLVVEVGFFPAPSQTIQLRTENFTLRADNDDQAFFPAAPDDIASALGTDRRNPRFFPTVGVGYGGGGWDRGVSTGVGVDVAGPYPRRGGMARSNRSVMEDELRDKSLPGGSLTQPVAGYLYFPLDGKRSAHYNLELTRDGETISLALPAPQK